MRIIEGGKGCLIIDLPLTFKYNRILLSEIYFAMFTTLNLMFLFYFALISLGLIKKFVKIANWINGFEF